ncbi:C-C chemokine receptor type 3-like [Boleophthalmus pectinirostris]|uniref:C-C chemokine receptor type 3-like n=1 Tax=Boleophthalmus pectinirostris TaxID=150288 RepID=UPI00242E458F|nr:C-C chemokine receptor type 3-like [Boleophthalmus pectinirostris]XP_055006923.1 C-C chemokine receptor type 3-like [Boleophthalmus pectinirostris]
MDFAMESTNASTEMYPDYNDSIIDWEKQENQSYYIPAIFYSLVFAFSLSTNILVLIIIHRFERLTTVTNLLLLNLVLSSLLFISSLPFLAVYILLSHWPFGRLMCKLVGSVYYLGFNSSVLFLALMTFDRHLAVVYSISSGRLRSRAYALVSCGAVWLVSALACIKPMILQNLIIQELDNIVFCQENKQLETSVLQAVGFYMQLLLFFLFPLLLIIYCYMRIACTVLSSHIGTKFKTVRLIFVIVLLFFTCWTPFNIALLMHARASTPEEYEKWRSVLVVTQKFAHLYFCISPIFYTFVGKKFQNYFLMLVVRRFPGLRRHVSISQSRTNMSTKSTPNSL